MSGEEPSVQVSASLPTREQIAETLYVQQQTPAARIIWAELPEWVRSAYLGMADAVLALFSQPIPAAEDAWEQAAQIAERDSIGVTLADLNQFPVVQATGTRIAFNIRAEAQKQNGADR
ncbi:hypothetical protein HUN58_14500 [Curtobacterium sp. Csp1]|uniref:hypothetical protein n=1 Tax=unclassified Curtobacterium TaxID=257496 RepID=UPI00159AAFA4|nr:MULTISPECIES: hypothetical protein [unclassified Curtobacterium]QKS13921.1 hypothetical protein HUN60_12935 [Curtobacterium sp. csp3]QKS20964.1 hypothetical protein HUN58_14500 [Curtobacterium sp. Csp1]